MEKQKKHPSRTSKRKASSSMEVLTELHQFREIFYRFFSRSFSREPEARFLKDLPAVSGVIEHLVSEVKDDDLRQGKASLEEFLQEIKGRGEEDILKNLAEQYASLFLGVGPVNLSLCESVYRSERGLFFQDSYFAVLEEYRNAGLVKQEDFTEPEDHLSVELAFMAHLCRRSAEALGKGAKEETKACYRLQKGFLNNHLDQWVPRFVQGLLDVNPSGLYRALAYLLKGYVNVDRTWVDELLTEIGTCEDLSSGETKKSSGKEVKKSVKGKGND